ncbi:MAG: uroporphyrinogen-III C-methyltransferase, partial [Erythrobacter sp.]|nr:uroporphyrinogen-III C-methyltransferase [Erythrobacter sp.]
ALPDMRVVRGMLAGLPDLVIDNAIKSPALIVIGDVAARNDLKIEQVAVEAAQ